MFGKQRQQQKQQKKVLIAVDNIVDDVAVVTIDVNIVVVDIDGVDWK